MFINLYQVIAAKALYFKNLTLFQMLSLMAYKM